MATHEVKEFRVKTWVWNGSEYVPVTVGDYGSFEKALGVFMGFRLDYEMPQAEMFAVIKDRGVDVEEWSLMRRDYEHDYSR